MHFADHTRISPTAQPTYTTHTFPITYVQEASLDPHSTFGSVGKTRPGRRVVNDLGDQAGPDSCGTLGKYYLVIRMY